MTSEPVEREEAAIGRFLLRLGGVAAWFAVALYAFLRAPYVGVSPVLRVFLIAFAIIMGLLTLAHALYAKNNKTTPKADPE